MVEILLRLMMRKLKVQESCNEWSDGHERDLTKMERRMR